MKMFSLTFIAVFSLAIGIGLATDQGAMAQEKPGDIDKVKKVQVGSNLPSAASGQLKSFCTMERTTCLARYGHGEGPRHIGLLRAADRQLAHPTELRQSNRLPDGDG